MGEETGKIGKQGIENKPIVKSVITRLLNALSYEHRRREAWSQLRIKPVGWESGSTLLSKWQRDLKEIVEDSVFWLGLDIAACNLLQRWFLPLMPHRQVEIWRKNCENREDEITRKIQNKIRNVKSLWRNWPPERHAVFVRWLYATTALLLIENNDGKSELISEWAGLLARRLLLQGIDQKMSRVVDRGWLNKIGISLISRTANSINLEIVRELETYVNNPPKKADVE